jgi:hypothetical protein
MIEAYQHEARITNLEMQLEQALAQIELLLAHRTGKPKLQYAAEFPDAERIVKLQAQLFINDPCQGRAAKVIKVYVWDDRKQNPNCWEDGYFMPFNFPLRRPANYPIAGNKLVIEDWAERLAADPDDWWLGCLSQKGLKKHDGGSKVYACHAAVLAPNLGLFLNVRGHDFEFGDGEPTRPSGNPKHPTHVWYCHPHR